MWGGRKFHIEGDVTLSSLFLIGSNDSGQTQTVEDILNGLSGSAEFTNITAIEVKEDNVAK